MNKYPISIDTMTWDNRNKSPSDLFTKEQLQEYIMDVLPKISSISTRLKTDYSSTSWKKKTRFKRDHDTETYIYDISPSPFSKPMYLNTFRPSFINDISLNKWPESNNEIIYAGVTYCTLQCPIEEVVQVLFTNSTIRQAACSMKALCGNTSYLTGDLLLSQNLNSNVSSLNKYPTNQFINTDEMEWIGIKTAVLQPKERLTRQQVQKLCFTAYTKQFKSEKRAIHLMKTLPVPLHDQFISSRVERSALCNGIDHIAVGYDISGSYNEFTGHCTRITICSYASVTRSSPILRGPIGAVPENNTVIRRNPQAKYIVQLLAQSACDFARIIQRRRLGQQQFSYFPTTPRTTISGRSSQSNTSSIGSECTTESYAKACLICLKSFHLFRKEFYCQLCSSMVCRDCSKRYEVESTAGNVRHNRICFACVGKVNTCMYSNNGRNSMKTEINRANIKGSLSYWSEPTGVNMTASLDYEDKDFIDYNLHHGEVDSISICENMESNELGDTQDLDSNDSESQWNSLSESVFRRSSILPYITQTN